MIRHAMIANAKAHNKFLTDTYISTLTDKHLLALCYPNDRDDYKDKLRRQS